MYPPPNRDVLEKLKGSPVRDVSFGRYVIHLTFENEDRLSFVAPFRFSKTNLIQIASVIELPVCETELVRIIGKTVTDVGCDADGTLELIFDNEDQLIVYANDPMYEAYTLFIGMREYVV